MIAFEILLGITFFALVGLVVAVSKILEIRKLAQMPETSLIREYEAYASMYLRYRDYEPELAENARKKAAVRYAVMEGRGIIQ